MVMFLVSMMFSLKATSSDAMQRRGVVALILMVGLLRKAEGIPTVSEPRLRRTQYIHPGHHVVLNCSAEGSQIFRLTWMKYGQRIQVSTGQYGPLTIKKFALHDQGHYTCRVDDDEGYDVSPVVSLVLAQLDDQWSVAVRDVVEEEMSPMSLTCNQPPFCVPPGKYSWYRLEGKKPSQVKTTKRIMIDNNGTLHFAFAEEADTGIYRCGIYNTVLEVTKLGSQVNVTVQTDPNALHVIDLLGGIPPRPLSYSAEMTAVLGKVARLECIFSGKPAPSVTWSRNGPNIMVDPSGTLIIQRVGEGDGGTYSCTGMNSVDKVSQTLKLTVVSGPIWERKPVTQNVSEGHDVTFVCTGRAIGPTSPIVTQWINELGTNRRGITLSRDKSALTFNSVSGGTECVTCNISNNIDFISKTACYTVIKSSSTLLIIVTCCSVLGVILTVVVVMFFVIYRKVNDLGNRRFRLSSISSRRRRNTIVNATVGKSTGYLELDALSSRFSASAEHRLLSEAFRQHWMDVPYRTFRPVRKSVSHNFLRDINQTDMNKCHLRPITRHNSESCISTHASYIHPNHNLKTSSHMVGSFTEADTVVNQFSDSRGDVGCRNLSERYQEDQNGESRKETRIGTVRCTHNCRIDDGDKPWAAGQRNTKGGIQGHQNNGQLERTQRDGWTPGTGRCLKSGEVKHQDMKTCFDKGSGVENGGTASRIVRNPHLGHDANLIEKEMSRLCSEFEMCPEKESTQ